MISAGSPDRFCFAASRLGDGTVEGDDGIRTILDRSHSFDSSVGRNMVQARIPGSSPTAIRGPGAELASGLRRAK
jgi:hypothetical protein